MDFQQIRKYVKGVLTNSFLNKTTLDKLSTSNEGNLLFDGKEINSGSSSETSNSFYLIDYNSMESVNSRNFTAEKDCYIEVETYANDNKEEHYFINGIFVGRESINGEVIYLKNFFLRKGDTISFRDGVAHTTTIRVFSLKATESSYHNYSTEEKVVGKWVDGKTIYEKTFDISNRTFANDTWYNLIALSNVDIIINYSIQGDKELSNIMSPNSVQIVNDTLRFSQNRGTSLNIGVCFITIQYTKTTD